MDLPGLMQPPEDPDQTSEGRDRRAPVNAPQEPGGGQQCGVGQGDQTLGLLPDEIPLAAARDIERQQQRGPGAEAANAFGDDRRGRGMAQPARQARFEPVHANERQVDQGGDPQTHVIEPDQDPQPAVGHQAQKGLQAPFPIGGLIQAQALHGGQARAQRAVLVVPGWRRRHLEEGLNDGRHPQTPALHPHRLGHHTGQPVAGEQMAQRLETAIEDRRQHDQVDAEQRGGDRPVDDPGQRVAIELFETAGYSAEINGAPTAEQGIGDIVVDRLADDGAMDQRVAQQLVAHGLQLRGIEVPGQHAAHAAAHQPGKQVGAAGVQASPLAAQTRNEVRHPVHPGTDHGADQEPGCEALPARCRHQIVFHDPHQPQPQHDAAAVVARHPEIVPQAPQKRRAAIETFDQGPRQTEQQRTQDDAGQHGRRRQPLAQQRVAVSQTRQPQNQHEQGAIHRAFGRTLPRLWPQGRPLRTLTAQALHQQPGRQEGLRPQPALGHGRQTDHAGKAHGRMPSGQGFAAAPVGHHRRPGRPEPAQRHAHQQTHIARRPTVEQPSHAPECRKIEPAQQDAARHCCLQRLGRGAAQHDAPPGRQQRTVTQQQQQVETDRYSQERQGTCRGQRRVAAHARQQAGQCECRSERCRSALRERKDLGRPARHGPERGLRVGRPSQTGHDGCIPPPVARAPEVGTSDRLIPGKRERRPGEQGGVQKTGVGQVAAPQPDDAGSGEHPGHRRAKPAQRHVRFVPAADSEGRFE